MNNPKINMDLACGLHAGLDGSAIDPNDKAGCRWKAAAPSYDEDPSDEGRKFSRSDESDLITNRISANEREMFGDDPK